MAGIADIRTEYKLRSLDEKDAAPDPIRQFAAWWQDAVNSEIPEVNAMTLCTITLDGKPDGRIVLLKEFDERGFVFFTNYQSQKGRELAAAPFATLVFFWKELERQVRINGVVKQLDAIESDAYFKSRPVNSQLGAWTSPQSELIANRQFLENRLQKYKAGFAGDEIPRPPHWGGYLVMPDTIEFWQGRPSRLHDRLVYKKITHDWAISRLAP